MPSLAMLPQPDALNASVGAWNDCHSVVRLRIPLVLADGEGPALETRFLTLSVDGGPVLLCGGGLLPVDGAIETERGCDLIWLPSFLAHGVDSMRQRLARSGQLIAWLKRRHAEGATIAASGPAVLMLAAAGLVGATPVPLAPALRTLARTLFPKLKVDENGTLADLGNLILSAGLAYDLAAVTRGISRTLSPYLSSWIGDAFAIPEQAWPAVQDPQMVSARLWLEQAFASGTTIAELAERLSLSQSTLTRKFRAAFGVSPKAYLQTVRLDAAKQMLAKTNRSIEQVAALVGYSDPRLFRTMFSRHAGQSPRAWRLANRPRPPA